MKIKALKALQRLASPKVTKEGYGASDIKYLFVGKIYEVWCILLICQLRKS
ncbi:hypothetical protein JYQ62_23535 [Nostoc sp. UHCC 0702]|nr:hypothetical protein JYQ62_23535 [Nostoc sp. UHCC 0702]